MRLVAITRRTNISKDHYHGGQVIQQSPLPSARPTPTRRTLLDTVGFWDLGLVQNRLFLGNTTYFPRPRV
jgi:hypothetical protein